VVTTVLALVIQKTIGFRIDPEHETTGVDLVVHGETAYDLHVATSGARPHLGG
jgi:Amt family ammonium transporter